MLELFHDVEDLEDTNDLHKIYEVFKSMSKSFKPIFNYDAHLQMFTSLL